MSSGLTEIVGLFLIAEGIGSLIAFREQPLIFQLGRAARVGIGGWLLLKD